MQIPTLRCEPKVREDAVMRYPTIGTTVDIRASGQHGTEKASGNPGAVTSYQIGNTGDIRAIGNRGTVTRYPTIGTTAVKDRNNKNRIGSMRFRSGDGGVAASRRRAARPAFMSIIAEKGGLFPTPLILRWPLLRGYWAKSRPFAAAPAMPLSAP